jgi:hypothetical protein
MLSATDLSPTTHKKSKATKTHNNRLQQTSSLQLLQQSPTLVSTTHCSSSSQNEQDPTEE